VLHAARWKCRTQKNRQKSPSAHHRTNLSGYIFATKAYVDNRKKNLLNSNISSTCLHNTVNVGPLTAEIGWRVWGTPANFNGFRVLLFVTEPTSLSGGQPNLRPSLAIAYIGSITARHSTSERQPNFVDAW